MVAFLKMLLIKALNSNFENNFKDLGNQTAFYFRNFLNGHNSTKKNFITNESMDVV